jgi:hypothetical protein
MVHDGHSISLLHSLQAIRQSGDQQRAVKELVSFSEERADFITKALVN